VLIGALLASTLVFLAPAPAAPPNVEEVRLVGVDGNEQRPFLFDPDHLSIPSGTTVRWVNTLDVFHTVTFADSEHRRISNRTFDRSLAAKSANVDRRFDTPGTFFYFCQPHSTFMAGSITVHAPAGAGDTARPTQWTRSAFLVTGLATVIAGLFVVRVRRRRTPPGP
jgi:plastocyanin